MVAAVALVGVSADDEHVAVYTADNFKDEVAKSNQFVMFYAPWWDNKKCTFWEIEDDHPTVCRVIQWGASAQIAGLGWLPGSA